MSSPPNNNSSDPSNEAGNFDSVVDFIRNAQEERGDIPDYPPPDASLERGEIFDINIQHPNDTPMTDLEFEELMKQFPPSTVCPGVESSEEARAALVNRAKELGLNQPRAKRLDRIFSPHQEKNMSDEDLKIAFPREEFLVVYTTHNCSIKAIWNASALRYEDSRKRVGIDNLRKLAQMYDQLVGSGTISSDKNLKRKRDDDFLLRNYKNYENIIARAANRASRENPKWTIYYKMFGVDTKIVAEGDVLVDPDCSFADLTKSLKDDSNIGDLSEFNWKYEDSEVEKFNSFPQSDDKWTQCISDIKEEERPTIFNFIMKKKSAKEKAEEAAAAGR